MEDEPNVQHREPDGHVNRDSPSDQPTTKIDASMKEKHKHAEIYASRQLLAKIMHRWGETSKYLVMIKKHSITHICNFCLAKSMNSWKFFAQIHPKADLLARSLHHWKKIVRLQQIVSGNQILDGKIPGSFFPKCSPGHFADYYNQVFVADTDWSICDSDAADMDSVTSRCNFFPCMTFLVELARWLGAASPLHLSPPNPLKVPQ